MNAKTHVAYLVTWTEYERGWGCRPDGASLHLTQKNAKEYISAYWKTMPKEAPYEYSREDSATGRLVAITPKLYNQLKKARNHSIVLWQTEYTKLCESGDIKK